MLLCCAKAAGTVTVNANEQPAPEGKPVQAAVTLPVNPLIGVNATGRLVLDPACSTKVGGVTVNEKSAGAKIDTAATALEPMKFESPP